MKPSILAALLVLAGDYSRAADVRSDHRALAAKIADPELRSMAEQVLQRNNRYYEQEAVENQTKKGENFTYLRVEVTGVMSSDDTGEYDRDLFQKQIKPSFSAIENMTAREKARYALARKIDPLHTAELIGDSVEYSKAASGETTKNAREKLAPYRDAEINELVAHSWGCELIYAAILNGDIPPPKKLIVIGVPDNDRKKWDLLAAYTGTEVHWARSDNDVVKTAQDDAEIIGLKAGASIDFKARWKAVCDVAPPNKRSCQAHGRTSKPVIVEPIGKLPGIGGHSRTEYYDVLKKNKVLKGTYKQLHASMLLNLEAETVRIKKESLTQALVEARGLVVQAHEQARIAKRDRDERLKHTLADMARRSCENPGSITQAEIDRLPATYVEDFNSFDTLPGGLGECPGKVYIYIGMGLNAKEIRAASTPPAPVAAAAPITAAPRPAVAQGVAKYSFFRTLPKVRDFAVSSCGSPGRVPLTSDITRPSENITFSTADEAEADRLSAGLGTCERQLFRKLIHIIRTAYPQYLTTKWVEARVREYTPAPAAGQSTYEPSRGSSGNEQNKAPATPKHDAEGAALRQLKRAAGN